MYNVEFMWLKINSCNLFSRVDRLLNNIFDKKKVQELQLQYLKSVYEKSGFIFLYDMYVPNKFPALQCPLGTLLRIRKDLAIYSRYEIGLAALCPKT